MVNICQNKKENIICITMDLGCGPLSDGLILEHMSAQKLFQSIIHLLSVGMGMAGGWYSW